MFNFLFKPNAIVEQRANAHLNGIYGRNDVEYVAWHWYVSRASNKAITAILVACSGVHVLLLLGLLLDRRVL